MNLLCDKTPDTITVSGVDYKINTDFRVWIKFELILTNQIDDTLSAEILAEIQKLVFRTPCPMNEETVEAILNFYRCGKPPKSIQAVAMIKLYLITILMTAISMRHLWSNMALTSTMRNYIGGSSEHCFNPLTPIVCSSESWGIAVCRLPLKCQQQTAIFIRE